MNELHYKQDYVVSDNEEWSKDEDDIESSFEGTYKGRQRRIRPVRREKDGRRGAEQREKKDLTKRSRQFERYSNFKGGNKFASV